MILSKKISDIKKKHFTVIVAQTMLSPFDFITVRKKHSLSIGNGDLNFNASLQVDRCDLFHDLRR